VHAALPNFFTSSPHFNRLTELRLKVPGCCKMLLRPCT
jgi:hypothetical protein